MLSFMILAGYEYSNHCRKIHNTQARCRYLRVFLESQKNNNIALFIYFILRYTGYCKTTISVSYAISNKMDINSIFILNVRKLRQKSNIDGVRLMKTVSDKHIND